MGRVSEHHALTIEREPSICTLWVTSNVTPTSNRCHWPVWSFGGNSIPRLRIVVIFGDVDPSRLSPVVAMERRGCSHRLADEQHSPLPSIARQFMS
jgi:hypothetical protein